MVIFGMRRGGKKYHILNITNRTNPVYVAEISKDAKFAKLGQTWSKPIFATMEINNSPTKVLVFGGGYDTGQDSVTSRAPDKEGNAIYIINAADGTHLKTISNTGADVNITAMTNAIPSDIATIDLNGNAIVDRLYASDVGGRIIRIDIDDDITNKTSTITGGVIADINSGNPTPDHRKFFATPQVGYYSKAGRQFLSIMIGSGDIAHPLDRPSKSKTATDRFYMIKDPHIWVSPDWDTFNAATDSDFTNATDSAVNAFGTKGWYINYTGNEKSFSKAVLYDYAIIFTTYSPKVVDVEDPCTAAGPLGTARIYALNMLSANGVLKWNGDSNNSSGANGGTDNQITTSDRSTELKMQGVPPSPQLIFPGTTVKDKDGNAVKDNNGKEMKVMGKKILLFADLGKKHEWSDRFRSIYWEEVIDE
jgi:type IV pilus assembly protein PilY1